MDNTKLIQKLIMVLGFFGLIFIISNLNIKFKPLNNLVIFQIWELILAAVFILQIIWGRFVDLSLKLKFLAIDWREWKTKPKSSFIIYFGTLYLSVLVIFISLIIIVVQYIFGKRDFNFELNFITLLITILNIGSMYIQAKRTWEQRLNLNGEFPGWLD